MTKLNNISMITFGLIMAVSLTVTGAVAQTMLAPDAPKIDTVTETDTTQYLTENEKARTLDIIRNDVQTKNILVDSEWNVKHIGPRLSDSVKYGSLVFIKLDEPKWVEETVINPFSKDVSNVKSWVKSLHVAVDLNTNEVSGIDLGMTRPVIDRPISDPQIESAELVAKNTQTLGQDVNSRLVAVYETDEYPQGLAFFSIMSTDGKSEEMMVINLESMSIEEKYSGEVGRIQS